MDPENTKVLTEMLPPKNVPELRWILGILFLKQIPTSLGT